MIVVKLNEKYPNDFLTTHNGYIFYKKNNTLDKEETVLEVDEKFSEISRLIQQGILIIVEDKRNDSDVVNKIKENIDTSVKGMVTEDRKEAVKVVKESLKDSKEEIDNKPKEATKEQIAEEPKSVDFTVESTEDSNDKIINNLN